MTASRGSAGASAPARPSRRRSRLQHERRAGCRRRQGDRRLVGSAEERDRRVQAGDVDEPPDAQLIAAERLAVRANGVFAVGAGRQVPEVRGRQRLPRAAASKSKTSSASSALVMTAGLAGAVSPQTAGRYPSAASGLAGPRLQQAGGGQSDWRCRVCTIARRCLLFRTGSDPGLTPV